MIEGESLLNDGTAVVIINFMLTVALTGKFNLLDSVASFLRVSIGGTVVGLLLRLILCARYCAQSLSWKLKNSTPPGAKSSTPVEALCIEGNPQFMAD